MWSFLNFLSSNHPVYPVVIKVAIAANLKLKTILVEEEYIGFATIHRIFNYQVATQKTVFDTLN